MSISKPLDITNKLQKSGLVMYFKSLNNASSPIDPFLKLHFILFNFGCYIRLHRTLHFNKSMFLSFL
jgi:hypothetical protein